LDDESSKEPSICSVRIQGQQDLYRFLDQVQAGGLAADTDRKTVIREFDELIDHNVYWLKTKDSFSGSLKTLYAWTKNQDAALEDEVTR